MKNLDNLLKKRIVILDGAAATELQKRGMPAGVCPEEWCLKNPEVITSIHSDYVSAGADIIYTCTFGANRIKLAQYGIGNVSEVNRKLASLAKKGAGKKALIAGDIGPTGKFVQPFGKLEFDEAVDIFKEQVRGLIKGGVDLFVIETMMDIQEARAALIAVRELSDKFTIVTMTYEKSGRTLNGVDPLSALITLQSLGASALGSNCSTGPAAMLDIIKKIKPYATVPLVAKPNAGIPKLIGGKTTFDMGPQAFASFGPKFALAGVNMLGGCCGTTPAYISELKKKVSNKRAIEPKRKSISALSCARKNIIIEPGKELVVIGECINPTGKKDLQSQLRLGKTSLIRQLAKEQEGGGAHLLDVNVGAAGVDEVKTLKRIVSFLSLTTDLPLVIDSSKVEAVEAALRIYPGRSLINSIPAQKKKLDKLLSVAKKYGAMFILLPICDKGIPKDFIARKRIVEAVFKKAKKLQFSKEDIVVDGLALTVSSQPDSAVTTMKLLSWCSKIFKCNTVLGLSNISFGMPGRRLLNAAYLKLARSRGLSMVIANPKVLKVKSKRIAEDVLTQKDKNGSKFIAYFAKQKSRLKKEEPKSTKITAQQRIANAIKEGNKEEVNGFLAQALNAGIAADKLVNEVMIPAINKVGDLFDRKEYFLPQLIASAETMKIAFGYLKPYLKKSGLKSAKKTVVLLATVKGDIHDIGKNIVALILRNHGFSVIDLGKDVSAKKIISAVKRYKHPVVGLSALMTTTMVNMKEVIQAAKKERLDCRFIVGGAVITKAYANSLGVQYAKDGVEAVRLLKKLDK